VLPRLKQFTVVGIFEAGHYEFDSSLAFIQIDTYVPTSYFNRTTSH